MTRSYCLCNSICVCVRLRLNIRKIIIIKGTSIDDLEIIQEQNGSLLISSTAFVAYLENSSSHFAENEGHSDSTSSEDDSFKEQHQEEFQFIADACRHCRGLGNNIFPHPRTIRINSLCWHKMVCTDTERNPNSLRLLVMLFLLIASASI